MEVACKAPIKACSDASLLLCKWVLLKLFYQPDGISLVGVILSVFVFTKVLEHEILALILGNLDEHLAVSYLAILQIALVGVIAYGLLGLAVFYQLKSGYLALALSYVDIQAVALEDEHEFTTLGDILTVKVCCVAAQAATQQYQ